jgi:hypothetical protein
MLLKPNDLPELVEDEIRRVTVNLSGAIGVNTITDAEVTSSNLTLGSPSINGSAVSFLLTASSIGTHNVLISADLSSGETIKGYVRAKVSGEPCQTNDDYR